LPKKLQLKFKQKPGHYRIFYFISVTIVLPWWPRCICNVFKNFSNKSLQFKNIHDIYTINAYSFFKSWYSLNL